MAETSSQDSLMPLTQLRAAITLAKREPLGCAFGLTKDKKEALLLIDKKAKPKKVAAKLRADGKAFLEPATLRFGELSIDMENDPGLGRFKINKSEAGGTITLLSRLVKKAGLQSIVIDTDPALDAADENEAETASPQPDAVATTSAEPPPPPPPPPPSGQAKARLTALVQRIGPLVAANPALKASLTGLAREVQALVLAGQPADAKMDELEAAIGAGSGTTGSADAKPGDGKFVALAKSSQIWRACRGQMHSKLDQLKASILDAYAGEPDVADEIRKNLGELDRAFDGLDSRLEDTLDAAFNEADPEKRRALVQQSRTLMAEYAQYVSSSPMLQALDDNPFGVTLGLKETVSKVMTAMTGLSNSVN